MYDFMLCKSYTINLIHHIDIYAKIIKKITLFQIIVALEHIMNQTHILRIVTVIQIL